MNQAHLDPRVETIPGTPDDEPEALITIPLIARDSIKGALNIYRLGEDASFDDDEFELAKRFGDAAALALDNAQIRARLEHQAMTDSLTGLYNHRAFHERLREALASASRSHDAVSVLMLDIDDFKRVNDIYGHGAGDEILRGLAETLKDAVRSSDVVYRLGGEEFAIVITSRSPQNAEQLAHRVVDRVESTDFDPAGRITISVGLARGPEHAMNPRELIACAEAAMMSAKARGKNQIVLYEDSAMERPDGRAGALGARRALGRAHEDAAEPRRQAQPPQRREADRQRDRHRAARIDRLPQLPRLARRGRRRDSDRVRRPVHERDARADGDPRVQGRRGHHRPCRADRRVAADRRRGELRVRAHPARHRLDRRVAGRRAR